MEKDLHNNIIKEKNEKINKIAKQLLKEIGIKQHISEFRYWLTALNIVTVNENEKR